MSDKDYPAFPRNYRCDGHNGMTLRDYFAAKAMQGFLTNHDTQQWGFVDIPQLTNSAYQMADAMLEARKA